VTVRERLGLSVAGWSEGALLTRVPSDVTVCSRPARATTKILETSVHDANGNVRSFSSYVLRCHSGRLALKTSQIQPKDVFGRQNVFARNRAIRK
jgi:hypothetical protein